MKQYRCVAFILNSSLFLSAAVMLRFEIEVASNSNDKRKRKMIILQKKCI